MRRAALRRAGGWILLLAGLLTAGAVQSLAGPVRTAAGARQSVAESGRSVGTEQSVGPVQSVGTRCSVGQVRFVESEQSVAGPVSDPAVESGIRVGMTDTAAYFPLLRGCRVAVLANQTSVAAMPGAVGTDGQPVTTDAAGRIHLVDLLHECGFKVTAIFSPEHGFRGTADAGEIGRASCRERV